MGLELYHSVKHMLVPHLSGPKEGAVKKAVEEGLPQIDAYRNSVLTASGLLITIPFLAESILVAFGHFSKLGVILVTLPMMSSAICFSLAIYFVVGAFRKLAQASGVKLSLDLLIVAPKEFFKDWTDEHKKRFLEEAEKLAEMPYVHRQSSARWFSRSEVTFNWGVLFLILSLFVLALNLVF